MLGVRQDNPEAGDRRDQELPEERRRHEGARRAHVDFGAVFTYENGESLKPQYVTRLFEKLRQLADLPPMTFHGLRHQHASLQLAAGTPLAVVSKRLGHQSVAITADIYSHLLRSTEHEAANNAAALVPPRRNSVHALHTQGAGNEEEAASAMSGNGP